MISRLSRSGRPADKWIACGLAAVICWNLTLSDHVGARVQLSVGALPVAISTLVALVTAYRVRPARRLASAWLWVGVALGFTLVGYIAEILQTATSWAPSVADVFFLSFYPIFLVGIMRFPSRRHTGTERVRLGLDVALISVCMASVIWQVVLAPAVTGSGAASVTDILAIAYPTADLLMVFGLVRLLVRGALPSCRRSVHLLGAGMTATILGDLNFVYGIVHSNALQGLTMMVFYPFSYALFVAAAIHQRPPDPSATVHIPLERVLQPGRVPGALAMPYVAPLLLVVLLVRSQLMDSALTRVMLSIAAGVAMLVVGARQFTVQRELTDRTGQLRHLALHDALTGLPNRALILDRVDGALARSRRHGTAVGVMFIDLDGFKRINDTYGHAIGDRLLCEVSVRLSATLRDSDTIGRLGGDEFVILIESETTELGSEILADRVRDVLAAPFLLGGPAEVLLIARASIGIAVGLRATADDLLRDADVALYAAKDAGKDRYVLFANEMQMVVQERLALEMELRDAVANDQLVLAYQPTIDLRTGMIVGTEALLRWQHPTRGQVMPDAFISLAEETGLIVPIGRQVLMQACRQTAAWHQAGYPLSISVNVSSLQLDNDRGLVADVSAALQETGLPAASLTLEITENVLVRDNEASAHVFGMLKDLGVRIAIDDFGTGYSSIAYLQRFPVDALKIDRSFVSAIGTSIEADALVHTLVQLGLALGLETCPEGIETVHQLAALRREHCETGQGYLFSKPLPPGDVDAFLISAPTFNFDWQELESAAD